MNTFIRKSMLFSGLLILMFLSISLMRRAFHTPFPIDESCSTIMTGDSHLQCAINDKSLTHIRNISTNSESYLYSYYKLQEIFAHHPHVTHAIVGFSYHNLSAYYDDYIIGTHARSVMPRYIDLFDNDGIIDLVYAYPQLRIPIVKSILSYSRQGYPYIDTFPASDTSHLTFSEQSMRKRITQQYLFNSSAGKMSEINLTYLRKIIQLCKSYQVKLTFINTPLHEKYAEQIPREYVDAYEAFLQEHDIPVIDFASLALSDKHFLPDGDHVNSAGATLTTTDFIDTWESEHMR